MYKKSFLLVVLLSSIALAWCSVPQNDGRQFPQWLTDTGMPLLPPPSWVLLPPPPGGPMWDAFRKKMEDACLSGVLQTGSDFFKDLTKNTTDKESKLLFIKEKLTSIANDASAESKTKVQDEVKIVDELIQEVKYHEQEFKKDPNKICTQKGEWLTMMNKKMREWILWLSGNMSEIREHEKKEWFLKNIVEKIFSRENSDNDKKSDIPKGNTESGKQD